jgi:hypothetical protein
MYTKQLLSSLSPYSGSTEMSDSSDPLSSLLLLDLSIDIGFLPAVGLLAKPLLEFGTFVVSKDTSSVVIVSSQITSYVACQ